MTASFVQIDAMKAVLFIRHKWNYMCVCTVKLYHIQKLKNATVKSVYGVMEYTMCSLVISSTTPLNTHGIELILDRESQLPARDWI